MKKIINIENKENQFISIEIIPLEDAIVITGLYKPKNRKPIDFISQKISIDSDDVNIIELIHDIAKKLDEKVNSTIKLYNLLKYIDKIEIIEK
jgi:hypothetical protein